MMMTTLTSTTYAKYSRHRQPMSTTIAQNTYANANQTTPLTFTSVGKAPSQHQEEIFQRSFITNPHGLSYFTRKRMYTTPISLSLIQHTTNYQYSNIHHFIETPQPTTSLLPWIQPLIPRWISLSVSFTAPTTQHTTTTL